MQATRLAQRASQTINPSEASRLVSEAARRASTAAPKRSRSLRKYTDVIAITVASIVAASALSNKRDHGDRVAMLEAELRRAEDQKDEATRHFSVFKDAVFRVAPRAAAEMENVDKQNKEQRISERTTLLQRCLQDALDEILSDSNKDSATKAQPNDDEKPKLI